MDNIMEENSEGNICNDEMEDEIIFNTLGKMNLLDIEKEKCDEDLIKISNSKRKRIEKAEDKIINKIYDKFRIENNFKKGDPIDLVYTFIDYDDREYRKSREKEIKKREYLKQMRLSIDTIDIVEEFLLEEKKSNNNFFINLELTRRNLSFIRNIIIITPTPFILNEVYHNDDNIFIINSDDLGCSNVFFRPNNIVYHLHKLKFLSNAFLFSTQDYFIGKSINWDDLFSDKLPKICWEKRTLLERNLKNNGIRYLEEYNANLEYEKKFHIFPKLVCLSQVNIIRKDVLQMMNRFYDYNMNIDYVLLNYLIGYFFNLYNLSLDIKTISSGIYEYNIKNSIQRLNLVKNRDVSYFCLNHIDNNYIPYYVYAAFINMGILSNSPIKNIYFHNFGKKSKYFLPTLEREIRRFGINILKWNKKEGRINEDLLISNGECKDVNMIKIEINELVLDKFILDILYFARLNNESNVEKRRMRDINIVFPKYFLRKMEMKTMVPYTRLFKYAEFDEETTGVKSCNIKFNSKLKK